MIVDESKNIDAFTHDRNHRPAFCVGLGVFDNDPQRLVGMPAFAGISGIGGFPVHKILGIEA
jgi:hypothetical protein